MRFRKSPKKGEEISFLPHRTHNSSSACAKKKSTKLFSKAHGKSATKAELRGERETRPQFSEREERRPGNLGHKLSFAPIPGLDPPSPSFRLPSLAHGAQNISAAPEKLGNEVAVHGTSRTRRVSQSSVIRGAVIRMLSFKGRPRSASRLPPCSRAVSMRAKKYFPLCRELLLLFSRTKGSTKKYR